MLNKSMLSHHHGFKMPLFVEERQTPDEKIYKNSRTVMSTSGKVAFQKKKEDIEEKEMMFFGVLMKHIEPNLRAWTILGELVKGADPIAVFTKLKET